MRDVRKTAEEADLLAVVIRVGIEAMRQKMAPEGVGPLSLGPVAEGWRASRTTVDGFLDEITAPEGAVVRFPVRRPPPGEGTVR